VIRRLSLTVVAALLLGACSMQFGYDRLDRVIAWYLDDYVELTGEQYAFVQAQLQERLCWHRRTQLPQYAAWLRRVDVGLQGNLALEELDRYEAEFLSYWKQLTGAIVPGATRLLATLSDRQVRELAERFELKNQEYAAEWVKPSPPKLRRQYARAMTKNLERWTGSLTSEQERAVERWSEDVALIGEERLAVRRAWQTRLLAALQHRQDRARLEPEVRALFVDFERQRTPAYQRQWEHNLRLAKRLILQVQASLTARQRTHLAERVAELAGDFETIAQEPSALHACAAIAVR
jgi:hypothetical protein